jgi:multidrug efflux pump subunit AcrA (membrane-fusion protein)
MSLSDDLSKKFNLVIGPPDQVKNLSNEITADSANRDFTQARASIAIVLKVGAERTEALGAMAEQSQDVNFDLALASIMKVTIDAAAMSLRLHKQKQELEAPDSNKTGTQTGDLHNHIHFPSMSTNDLKEALKTLKGPQND